MCGYEAWEYGCLSTRLGSMGVRVQDWRAWVSEYETREYGCHGYETREYGCHGYETRE